MAFKIPSVPPTTNKSVRFPNDMLEEIENAIRGKDCTFSAFVVAAVRAACDVTRSVSKMTEIERRGGKRWDKPKKAGKSRDCRGGKF